jgi:hypothetical protein
LRSSSFCSSINPKGPETFPVLLVAEKSGLLRSTGKIGQELVIALTLFTFVEPVFGNLLQETGVCPGLFGSEVTSAA